MHTCWVIVAGEGSGEGSGEDMAKGPTKTWAPSVGRSRSRRYEEEREGARLRPRGERAKKNGIAPKQPSDADDDVRHAISTSRT